MTITIMQGIQQAPIINEKTAVTARKNREVVDQQGLNEPMKRRGLRSDRVDESYQQISCQVFASPSFSSPR